MATVGTNIFNDIGTQSYFTLNNNEQYFRPFSLNYQRWYNLSLGVSFQVEQGATDVTGGLMVGLGNGFSSPKLPGSESITHYLGGVWGIMVNYIGFTGDYPILRYLTDVSGSYSVIKSTGVAAWSGGLVREIHGVGTDAVGPTLEDPQRRGFCMLRLYRSTSPNNIQVSFYTTTASRQTNINIPNYEMMTALQTIPGTPVVLSTNMIGSTQQTEISASFESRQPINMAHLWWSGSVPIRIYEMFLVSTNAQTSEFPTW